MHQKSFNIMTNFAVTYTDPERDKVLDVGSGIISSQLKRPRHRALFKDYTGLDVADGHNVDVVATEPYVFPLEDDTFDVVISGQAFEHIEFPWLTIREIYRVLKPGGYCCIIAPATGKYHKYPVDCWRYYPDGWRALAKWAGLEVVKVKVHWDNKWSDSQLVARKTPLA